MASRSKARPTADKAPVKLHVGRLAALVLLLVAAAFYVAPLRAFFAQQDRYHKEAAVLEREKAENADLRAQLERMDSRAFIVRQAREDFQLVPAGMQAFVIKGLPERPDDGNTVAAAEPPLDPPSLAERLVDLWQTLQQ
jgi:cell division protein FtsB